MGTVATTGIWSSTIGADGYHTYGEGTDNEFDVDLKVNIAFEDGTKTDLGFRFHHNETDGDYNPDPVDLPAFISPETVTVDGASTR
ncbi:hypothetical protein A8924_4866 [Saccharopolyspora erythraea NRRL 2338]|uniref:Uncharacterized protein n=2 Tax=Saccharopolyspora erythraea TaxID=1836 RepID=A4FI73_SACEN|nr:hypothetical protein [Saccharopolyspora erythraea]EQD83221.1 hypothetical protein N599_26435 [Saccharopolyspora erythraea D]PFG97428.1 hypothetical protein A8924_4866 [Saccharopolyspora erythraea NRRL 2338]QRK87608.1 hypothetical protein JQX30_22805 [Saccharopolyspora erythraea]CAM03748.1 hypothetical protein SACE_4479 [Saccharopolyspora erythraea NRRL 2338]